MEQLKELQRLALVNKITTGRTKSCLLNRDDLVESNFLALTNTAMFLPKVASADLLL